MTNNSCPLYFIYYCEAIREIQTSIAFGTGVNPFTPKSVKIQNLRYGKTNSTT